MSRIREFERTSMIYGQDRVAAVRLTCGKCGHAEDHPRGSTKTNVGPAEEAARYTAMFERKGWNVGKRRQDDRCPACMKKLGATAPQETVMETRMKEAMAAKTPAAQAETPRTATREEGRIIFAKIEEVYRDEKHGYQNGWSDHKVAEDLGVPRAWVETVRKQFFGPEGGNEDVHQVLDAARKLVTEAQALLGKANAVVAEGIALAQRCETIQRRIDHIQQVVGR
jgi:hypothetical protein